MQTFALSCLWEKMYNADILMHVNNQIYFIFQQFHISESINCNMYAESVAF